MFGRKCVWAVFGGGRLEECLGLSGGGWGCVCVCDVWVVFGWCLGVFGGCLGVVGWVGVGGVGGGVGGVCVGVGGVG